MFPARLLVRVAAVLAVAAVPATLSAPSAPAASAPAENSVGTRSSVGSAVPSALSIAAEPATVTYRQDTVVSGRLTVATGGQPLAAQRVELQRREPGDPWATILAANTDADGRVRFTREPGRSADFRLVHPASALADASSSAIRRVDVRHRLTAALSAAAVRTGGSVTIRGYVGPAHPNLRVALERASSGRWLHVAMADLSPTSRYEFRISPSVKGFRYYRVVKAADTGHLAATVRLPRLDVYKLHQYVVRTRGTIKANMTLFRASVADTYADPRGWARAHKRFARVSSGGDFTVVMSEAKYLPSYSSVCSTMYSCRVGRYVIINQNRWRFSSPYFTGPKEQYRRMVVNHETGHWLGLGHGYCSRSGALAPVMQQQSKGMQGCKPNAWPLPAEISAVS